MAMVNEVAHCVDEWRVGQQSTGDGDEWLHRARSDGPERGAEVPRQPCGRIVLNSLFVLQQRQQVVIRVDASSARRMEERHVDVAYLCAAHRLVEHRVPSVANR